MQSAFSQSSYVLCGCHRIRDHCYLSDTLFIPVLLASEVPASSQIPFIQACHLQPLSWVRGAFNNLQVVSIQVYPSHSCQTVNLVVDDCLALTVTGDHRIVTDIVGRRSKTVLAERLKFGDHILCSVDHKVEARILTHVGKVRSTVDIVRIRFKPDEPVEAFNLPAGIILSKGQATARRSRYRPPASDNDVISIPDTDYSGF